MPSDSKKRRDAKKKETAKTTSNGTSKTEQTIANGALTVEGKVTLT